MKIKTLSRSKNSVQRECSGDLRRESRNLNPQYHPMQKPREYVRAVQSAKMERMFAAPLIGNLGHGHQDAVTCSAVSRRSLLPLVSGAADGALKVWDLASRTCVATLQGGHTRAITGVVFDVQGDHFYSCADDGLVRKWSIHAQQQHDSDNNNNADDEPLSLHGPLETWRTPGSFQSMDHHWHDDQFVTASDEAVCLWSPDRTTPLQTHDDLWGSHDTVNVVRFNPAERCLVAHCSADRGIGLHDTRSSQALKKTVLKMRSNDLQWNPMEPMNFVVANEDYNAYTFDMRKLQKPTKIFKGHTSAVMSVSWSPTGREFVTGSYDKTIRIFPTHHGFARDIYHTKRMQRLFTVQYTMDHQFIVSGSDDTNLRLWKARASDRLGQQTPREEAASEYRAALIQKHAHLPEIRRIHKSRKIPKVIQKQTAQAKIQADSAKRKQTNRIKHSKPGTHEYAKEREQTVVKEID